MIDYDDLSQPQTDNYCYVLNLPVPTYVYVSISHYMHVESSRVYSLYDIYTVVIHVSEMCSVHMSVNESIPGSL